MGGVGEAEVKGLHHPRGESDQGFPAHRAHPTLWEPQLPGTCEAPGLHAQPGAFPF